MRLFAAIVPPLHVREELVEELLAAGGGSRELDLVPVRDLRIPVTSFGHVSQGDGAQLLAYLARAAQAWPRPELRFSGSAALEWPGDRSVWARLDGDVDGLLTVGRGVPPAVQRLGFLVDRRVFRPWMSVGSITDETSAPFLEHVVARLDEFKGTMWTLSTLTVMRKVPTDDHGGVEEVVHEEIPLGSG
jgi:2'-5' RNA ligase